MYLLDTDHLSELQHQQSSSRVRLVNRLAAIADDEVAASIVSIEEHMRGWLAKIHGQPQPRKQIHAYDQLQGIVSFYAQWRIVPWNLPATDIFESLRSQKVRIGTMDLKIASIAIANHLTLLTSNTRDFECVPGLAFEDWLA